METQLPETMRSIESVVLTPQVNETTTNKKKRKNPAPSDLPESKKQKNEIDPIKIQEVNAKVDEATCGKFIEILERFQNSNDEVYKFEGEMRVYERAAVHAICKKMGLVSRSSGKGRKRCVSVYKMIKKERLKEQENLVSFRFSEKSKGVLKDLFSRYPPGDMEATKNKVVETSAETVEIRAVINHMFCKPVMTKSGIANKVESLASKIEKGPKLRQITEERSRLPIASFKDVIISTTLSNQVVLICGETGCGKTTQVPQFLLDDAWNKGETCKIVCTQPRRISAISVAERIASERGEFVGDTVGYKIRLDSKGGRHSSLVFCTSGVLLNVLVNKGRSKMKKASSKMANGVSHITHIIVDEIHERDRFTDFMLAIIRDILPSNPHLRVVLMSATIDAERFSVYFGGCPIIRVPGFTYPVKSFYLEDVLSELRSSENNLLTSTKDNGTMENSILTEDSKIALDEAIDLALSTDEFDTLLELISSKRDEKVFNYQHSKTGVTPLMVFAMKGRVGDICMLLSFDVDCKLKSNAGKTAFDYAEHNNQGEAAKIIKKHMEKTVTYPEEDKKLLEKYLSSVNSELIDCVLIEQLLRRICSDSSDSDSSEGAILIFLPGWDDIKRMRERLLDNPFFNDSTKFVIIPLHSMIPSVEQKKVFKRPPPGCRKIVLSTNIAETSITIDDVVYVIDSGRMKEKNYDPYSNVSTLHSSWISKASAKQREGRAGRCQPGICYHLYSKFHADSLPDFQVPEIKRMPIEELCLQVKLIDPSCKIEDFLQKTLDPPIFETIRNAIIILQDIGALSLDENLTDLGKKLGSLPLHPLKSKMLFLGILLDCLDPALTLACASEYRDPFILPMLPDEKKLASDAKSELASFYGGSGDQLAVLAAFESWETAKKQGKEAQFCSKYFISSSTMSMISGMRKQLKEELRRNGFIPEGESPCSLNDLNPGILHAVLVAGLYPMVGKLLSDGKKTHVETVDGKKVRLNPSSTNAKLPLKDLSPQTLIAYDEVTRGDGGLYIRKSNIIGSLPFLLLAAEIVVAPVNEDKDEDDVSEEDRGKKIMSSADNSVKVIVDRWLPFESTALDAAQIYCLRERLSAAILFKVIHPSQPLPEHLEATLSAITRLLSYDGMSGISVQLKSLDSLAAMVQIKYMKLPLINRKLFQAAVGLGKM